MCQKGGTAPKVVGILCAILGLVLVIIGAVVPGMIEPAVKAAVKDAFEQKCFDDEVKFFETETDDVKKAENQARGPLMHLYMFDIMNPKEYLMGQKIKVEEKGPYVYETVNPTKIKVDWDENGDAVSYISRSDVTFDAGKSCNGCKETDRITTFNPTSLAGLNAIFPTRKMNGGESLIPMILQGYLGPTYLPNRSETCSLKTDLTKPSCFGAVAGAMLAAQRLPSALGGAFYDDITIAHVIQYLTGAIEQQEAISKSPDATNATKETAKQTAEDYNALILGTKFLLGSKKISLDGTICGVFGGLDGLLPTAMNKTTDQATIARALNGNSTVMAKLKMGLLWAIKTTLGITTCDPKAMAQAKGTLTEITNTLLGLSAVCGDTLTAQGLVLPANFNASSPLKTKGPFMGNNGTARLAFMLQLKDGEKSIWANQLVTQLIPVLALSQVNCFSVASLWLSYIACADDGDLSDDGSQCKKVNEEWQKVLTNFRTCNINPTIKTGVAGSCQPLWAPAGFSDWAVSIVFTRRTIKQYAEGYYSNVGGFGTALLVELPSLEEHTLMGNTKRVEDAGLGINDLEAATNRMCVAADLTKYNPIIQDICKNVRNNKKCNTVADAATCFRKMPGALTGATGGSFYFTDVAELKNRLDRTYPVYGDDTIPKVKKINRGCKDISKTGYYEGYGKDGNGKALKTEEYLWSPTKLTLDRTAGTEFIYDGQFQCSEYDLNDDPEKAEKGCASQTVPGHKGGKSPANKKPAKYGQIAGHRSSDSISHFPALGLDGLDEKTYQIKDGNKAFASSFTLGAANGRISTFENDGHIATYYGLKAHRFFMKDGDKNAPPGCTIKPGEETSKECDGNGIPYNGVRSIGYTRGLPVYEIGPLFRDSEQDREGKYPLLEAIDLKTVDGTTIKKPPANTELAYQNYIDIEPVSGRTIALQAHIAYAMAMPGEQLPGENFTRGLAYYDGPNGGLFKTLSNIVSSSAQQLTAANKSSQAAPFMNAMKAIRFSNPKAEVLVPLVRVKVQVELLQVDADTVLDGLKLAKATVEMGSTLLGVLVAVGVVILLAGAGFCYLGFSSSSSQSIAPANAYTPTD